MSSENPIVSWLVRLEGHPTDLSDAARFVSARPLVDVEQDADGHYYLKSSSLDGLTDGWEVLDRGNDLLARVNGALKAYLMGYKPVTANNVVPVHANGSRGVVVLVPTGHFEMRGIRPVIEVSGGTPVDETAEIRGWLECSNQDDDLADALRFLSRDPDWFDLYKVYEVISKTFRSKDEMLDSLCNDPSDRTALRTKVDLFSNSAQDYRHSRRSGSSPVCPMKLDEAHKLLIELTARFVRKKAI